MKKFMLLSLFLLLSTPGAFFAVDAETKPATEVKKVEPKKEDKAKEEKAKVLKELVDIVFNKEQILASMEAMVKALSENFQQETNKSLPVNKIMEYMAEKFTSKEFQDAVANIYDRNFSLEELKDLLKFYKSSTGKKLIEKTPEIVTETAQLGMRVGQEAVMRYLPKMDEEKPAAPESAAPKAVRAA